MPVCSLLCEVSCCSTPTPRIHVGEIDSFRREWIASVLEADPDYFERVKESQAPKYLWIGCSDSRVVAERALGLGVGQLFVHRNVGNCLSHADQNAMSALEYSVQVCTPWTQT